LAVGALVPGVPVPPGSNRLQPPPALVLEFTGIVECGTEETAPPPLPGAITGRHAPPAPTPAEVLLGEWKACCVRACCCSNGTRFTVAGWRVWKNRPPDDTDEVPARGIRSVACKLARSGATGNCPRTSPALCNSPLEGRIIEVAFTPACPNWFAFIPVTAFSKRAFR